MHLHYPIVGADGGARRVFARQGVTWTDYGRFIASRRWATRSAVVFVAILKYSHASRGEPE